MSFEGMDVNRAQALARTLGAHAQALAQITASIGSLAAVLADSWRGQAAVTFQHQCAAQYRPALGQAAQALGDMHTHLVANIQQQIRASAPDAGSDSAVRTDALLGSAIIAGGLHVAETVWKTANTVNDWGVTPLDKLGEIAGNDYVTGRYDAQWTRLINLDRDSDFLKYKTSPVLHGLHDSSAVQEIGGFLDKTHVTGVVKRLSPVGQAIGWVSVGVNLYHAGDDIYHHQYAAAGGQLVDATATGLMNSDNPALFLAGAGLTLLKDDYDRDPSMFNAAIRPTFDTLPGNSAGALEKAFL
ncbi:MAG: WXG100 family type VII secretion target [Streptosporangiaceae bacterium]